MLAVIALSMACLAPIMECPLLEADLSGRFCGSLKKGMSRSESRDRLVEIGWEKGCPICRGSGKVSLLTRWIHRNATTWGWSCW